MYSDKDSTKETVSLTYSDKDNTKETKKPSL